MRKQWSHNLPEEVTSLFNPLVGRLDWMSDVFHNSFRVDIKEVDNEYVLQAELPGVPKENINIQIDNDHLTISVQQEKQTADESPNYIRKERRTSYSSRSFYIGEVDPEMIKAEFKDGILEIRFPNHNSSPNTKRTIPIQ